MEIDSFDICDDAELSGGEEVVETTQDTGVARAWLSESMPGRRTGWESGADWSVGVEERTVEGNAREER